ncbi:MAG: hypothetical protein DI609_05750 [Corynebacterium urealyticum]|uniref:Minor tail protein n=1 Tax=Corynebacterium urealyticum TaxID=43771 RepID=A0A2W5B1Q4_9CORY|nr:MAG: hypothetical protein DI609_05750 [Corynebacterium urealyticum]
MTRVQGDLKIITGTAEAVTEVWVRSKTARPVPGGWLMTANDRRPVFGGKVDLELLPGACVLVAVSSGLPGETVELIVPESGTASLEACIRAAEAAGDLERDALDELRAEVAKAIDGALGSASAAASSAKAAKTDADRAQSSAEAASRSSTSAAGSASAASKSAASAKGDADRAANVASSTSWSGDRLTVNGRTSPPLTGPRGLKGERGERGEPGYRGVDGWATTPVETIDLLPLMDAKLFSAGKATLTRCGGAVFLTVTELKALKDTWGTMIPWGVLPNRLTPSMDVWSTLVSEAVNDSGRLAMRESGVVYVDSLQVGQPYNGSLVWWLPGGAPVPIPKVNEATWDGITGKPDLPTKAYVDGAVRDKADATHKHTLADITNLPAISDMPRPNTLVQRSSTGTIRVSSPNGSNNAANQGYVDDQDKATLAEAKALVESRPAFFSGVGSPPSTIPGAVVGDYYLNETTMELHKITGV